MIIILVFILVFILFLCFFIRNRITGGEYELLKSKNSSYDILPTISQRAIYEIYKEAQNTVINYEDIEYFNRCFINNRGLAIPSHKRLLDVDSIMKRIESKFQLANIEYNEQSYIRSILNSNRYLSDVTMDILLISNDCEHVYGVCEFSADFDIENGYTNIKYGNSVWALIVNSKDMELKNSILDMKHYYQNLAETTPNNEELIKFKHLYSDYYVDPKILIFSREMELVYYKDGEKKSINMFPNVEASKTIDVFIEFSYQYIYNMAEAYINVHKLTRDLLHSIFEASKTIDFDIVIYRILIDENGNYERVKPKQYKNSIIYVSENAKYKKIVIPASKSFAYDEYIEAIVDNVKYRIQIEHSEKGSAHKSNLVEFILRNSRDDEFIHSILNKFGYKFDENNKYLKKCQRI